MAVSKIVRGHSPARDDRQRRTPFLDALKRYISDDVAPFDVPNHKMGNFENEFMDLVGRETYRCDLNSPYGMDSILRPRGAVKEAEELCAEAFGADRCLFSVNGTTGGILVEICGVLKPKEKLILPRNVHRSIINAIVISGVIPVFVQPDIDPETGIANGVPLAGVREAIEKNPDAKAVLLINPTYFGVSSDIKAIADLAHSHGMICMADEAHASHYYFDRKLPAGALQAGFDITACSMHKTAGSLTQSSLILSRGNRVDWNRVCTVFGMLTTTSPSSLFIASIDAARKRMYFDGERLLEEAADLCRRTAERIREIPGISVIDRSFLTGDARSDLDPTRLTINVSGLGITGFDAYRELREKYAVQMELGEINCVLALFGVGSTQHHADRLVEALSALSEEYWGKRSPLRHIGFSTSFPELIYRPREAFNAPFKVVPLKDAEGEISAGSVMVYPPGIPFLIPGERVSADTIRELRFYNRHGGVVMSDTSPDTLKVIDRSRWFRTGDMDFDY